MKCIVHADHLSLAIGRVSGALRDKTVSYFALRIQEDNILEIQAVEHTIALFSTIPAQNIEKGTAFIPARVFASLVKELPPQPVELCVFASYVQISQGANLCVQLPLIEKGSWQTPTNLFDGEELLISSSLFRALVEKVLFCLSEEPSRNYGDIGYLHMPKRGSLCLATTDGFRLSKSEIPVSEKNNLKQGICISKHGLSELAKLCAGSDENLEIKFTKDHTALLACVENQKLYLLLSSTTYPDYQSVLAKEWTSAVLLERKLLHDSLRRILLTSDKNKTIKLQISSTQLKISSRNQHNFEGSESLPLSSFSGKEMKVSINGKFLMDILATSTAEQIELLLQDEEQPLLLYPKDENNECQSVHVLVPIKVEE